MKFEESFQGYLNDKRLERSGNKILSKISSKKTAISNQYCKKASEEMANRRFMSNPNIENTQLCEALYDWCQKKSKGKTVLAIQDTTELNYNKHAGRLSQEDKELGPVGKDSNFGFLMHPTLVVDATTYFPLGYSCIHLWNRNWDKDDKNVRDYKKQDIEEKESYRWIESSQKTKEKLKEAIHVTIIADRESDIYEEFVEVPNEKCDLLIRSSVNRRLKDSQSNLFEFLGSQSVAGGSEIEIKGHKKRKDRIAQMEIRFAPVKILSPANRKKGSLPAYVELYAIEIREKDSSVPDNEDPILWRLLTTHKVETVEDAKTYARWYSYRWWIEELFRVLKNKGLKLQDAQYESGIALKRLSILCLQAALRIMQLKSAREGEYDINPNVVFTEKEIKFQRVLLSTLEGKTEKQKNPHPPNNLAWSAWIIARLGGWKGRYSKKTSPGVITMKRGLEIFYQQFEGWCLATTLSPPKDVYGD